MCLCQHGSCDHIPYGITFWVRDYQNQAWKWNSQSNRYTNMCWRCLLTDFYKGTPLIHCPDQQSVPPSSEGAISSSKMKERWILGSVALFAGTLLWSSWFLLQSFIGKKYPYKCSSTVIMTFFRAIQSAVLTFSIDIRLSICVPKEKIDILSIFYAGFIGSGMCYVGMSWCVKKRGPVFTAAFSPLVQVMAAMFNVPILHE